MRARGIQLDLSLDAAVENSSEGGDRGMLDELKENNGELTRWNTELYYQFRSSYFSLSSVLVSRSSAFSSVSLLVNWLRAGV